MSIWGKMLSLGASVQPTPSWCRRDALVVDSGLTLLTHSGSRQPAIKTNDGEAAGAFCYNCGGNEYGGNWFALYLVGKTAEDCAFTCPNTSVAQQTFVYNGHTYYYSKVGMNQTYGGASVYNNPQNLPDMHDVQLFVVNGSELTSDGAIALGTFLELE